MIALVALTERTVTIKNPINPATVKIIFMCSVPVDKWGKTLHPKTCTFLTKCNNYKLNINFINQQ